MYIIRHCPFADDIKDKLFDTIEQGLDHKASSLGSMQTKWTQWGDVDEFQQLFNWIEDTIPSVIPSFKETDNPQAYKIKEYWGMIYQEGDGTHEHSHPPCPLSCAYYVNYPKGSAPLIVEGESIIPEEGDIVIFSGDALHSVPEGYPNKDRCMISLNVSYNMAFTTVYNVMCPECNHEDKLYEMNSYGCPKCNTITPKEDLLVKWQ